MSWLVPVFGLLGACVVALLALRLLDLRNDRSVWNELERQGGQAGPAFDPATVAALPAAAQRYFRYAIAPGTPLVSVAEIQMDGELGFGSKDEPAWRAMQAKQILVPPKGLVWKLRAGSVSGSDGATQRTSWTRFWLWHLIPVVRVSGTADHHRSAFGRVVAEGAFWLPASLLPGEHVVWQDVDADTARAIVSYGAYSQAVELTIEHDGRPSRICIQRWSNENPDREFREQPFGGFLSDFREVNGYRLPMHVEGGNHIGTNDYFPFYKANVSSIRFPQLA